MFSFFYYIYHYRTVSNYGLFQRIYTKVSHCVSIETPILHVNELLGEKVKICLIQMHINGPKDHIQVEIQSDILIFLPP